MHCTCVALFSHGFETERRDRAATPGGVRRVPGVRTLLGGFTVARPSMALICNTKEHAKSEMTHTVKQHTTSVFVQLPRQSSKSALPKNIAKVEIYFQPSFQAMCFHPLLKSYCVGLRISRLRINLDKSNPVELAASLVLAFCLVAAR